MSNVTYFAPKELIKVKILIVLGAQVRIHQISVIFAYGFASLFNVITPLYFLVKILYTFNKMSLSNLVKFNVSSQNIAL